MDKTETVTKQTALLGHALNGLLAEDPKITTVIFHKCISPVGA